MNRRRAVEVLAGFLAGVAAILFARFFPGLGDLPRGALYTAGATALVLALTLALTLLMAIVFDAGREKGAKETAARVKLLVPEDQAEEVSLAAEEEARNVAQQPATWRTVWKALRDLWMRRMTKPEYLNQREKEIARGAVDILDVVRDLEDLRGRVEALEGARSARGGSPLRGAP